MMEVGGEGRDASTNLPANSKYAMEAVSTLEEGNLRDGFHALFSIRLNAFTDCNSYGFGLGYHQVKRSQGFRANRRLGRLGDPSHGAVGPRKGELHTSSDLAYTAVEVFSNNISGQFVG